ncbi:hypothetical protein SUGI_1155130 [Cryptomeria japonica]|nr:hypothetical protein SUGI_1155130 [Cryptomeria japonica]
MFTQAAVEKITDENEAFKQRNLELNERISFGNVLPPPIMESASEVENKLIDESVEKTKWQKEVLKLKKREEELTKELKPVKFKMAIGLDTNKFEKVIMHADELWRIHTGTKTIFME